MVLGIVLLLLLVIVVYVELTARIPRPKDYVTYEPSDERILETERESKAISSGEN